MPTTNNITTTYVGKDSGAFISPTLYAGVTLGTPNVTIHNNVNYRSRITTLDLQNIIKDATCDFDATGTVNQAEVWLEVKKLEVNLQLCKDDYYSDFIGENTGAWGPLNNGAFLRYFMSRVGATVADAMESQVWVGVAGAGQINGIETLAGAPDVVATPTASTIADIMRQHTAAIPGPVLGASDLRFYLSNQNYNFFMQANNDKANANPCGENCVEFDGIRVVRAPGMADSSIILSRSSNLHFGTWMSSDLNRVSLIDQEPVDGSDNMNFVMKYFAGAQIGYRSEMTYSSAS